VPLGSFRIRPQKPDPKFQPQIVCATFVSPDFSMVDLLVIEVIRTTGRLINSRMGPAVPLNRLGKEKDRHSPKRTAIRVALNRCEFTATHPQTLHLESFAYRREYSTRIDEPAPTIY